MSLFILILIVVGFYLIKNYNLLQTQGQRLKASHSNIKNAIERKVELTNRLIDIVKGYTEHENLVFLKVSSDMSENYKKSNECLNSIKGLAFQFPELNSNTLYLDLTKNIVENENIILSRRDEYNNIATFYNSERIKFPFVLLSQQLGFKEAPYLDLDTEEKIKEFKTDDGEMLKDFIKNTAEKTADFTKKGIENIQNTLKKESEEENKEN